MPSSARVHRAIKKSYLSASLAFAETVLAFPFNSFGGLPKRRRRHVRKLATERLRSRELRNRIPSSTSGLLKEFLSAQPQGLRRVMKVEYVSRLNTSDGCRPPHCVVCIDWTLRFSQPLSLGGKIPGLNPKPGSLPRWLLPQLSGFFLSRRNASSNRATAAGTALARMHYTMPMSHTTSLSALIKVHDRPREL
jgi:hypothetical protein